MSKFKLVVEITHTKKQTPFQDCEGDQNTYRYYWVFQGGGERDDVQAGTQIQMRRCHKYLVLNEHRTQWT